MLRNITLYISLSLCYHPRHICDVIKYVLNDAVDFITECYPVNSVYVASVNVTILSHFGFLNRNTGAIRMQKT